MVIIRDRPSFEKGVGQFSGTWFFFLTFTLCIMFLVGNRLCSSCVIGFSDFDVQGLFRRSCQLPSPLIIKGHPLLPWRKQFWISIDASQAYHILLDWIEYSPGTGSLVGRKVGKVAEWSEPSVIFLISSVFKFLFLLCCTRELIHSLHWVGAGISGLG